MKVVLNGFGRIGRSILRAWLRGAAPGVDIVGINDIADAAACAYLLRWDSVFGPWPEPVAATGGRLAAGGWSAPLTHAADLSALDLRGVDLVMECTGRARTRAEAERGLRAGAARVLMSGPSDVADLTVVLGANDHRLAGQTVVSNASCTTNAVAPLLRVLDDAFGIETGTMTTIHCATGSQPMVDAAHGAGGDLARSRAASLSMVPTTTSAGALVDEVLPHLAGRVPCMAVRVPTVSVSAVDLSVMLGGRPDAEAVDAALAAARGDVIGWEADAVVSADMRMRGESYVHLPRETRVAAGGMVRVLGWYDNEWGFARRMLDVAGRMGGAR